MKKLLSNKFAAKQKQGGFIQGAVLFGLLILSLVVGAFALANKGSGQSATTEKDKVNAASVVKLGNDLRDAAFRFGMDYDLSAMTLDGDAISGLYDPAKGLTGPVDAPASAFATSPASSFSFVTDVAIGGVGSAADDFIFTLPNLTEGVCRQIQRTLTGAPLTTALPSAIGAGGAQEGCYDEDGNGVYTYFKVAQAN